MGGLVVDIIKTGCITLMCSTVVKVLGQKDTSDIIKATGASIIGVQTMMAITPLIKGIQEFNTNLGIGIDKIGQVIDKLTFWN